MTPTLTAFLLRARSGPAWATPGVPLEWHPEHVLLDDADGTVAALAFETAGALRVACELVLFAPQREASGPDGGEDLRYLQSFASAAGAHFVRPGAGTAAAIHRRRFALPGRVLASAVPGAAAAGALGMLVLPTCALECAAGMAGEPLLLARPRVVGVEWTGVPDPGVSGHDLLLALERRLAGEGAGAVLECFGIGLLSLPMSERFSIASRAGVLSGALATLFPSDDRTRGWLRASGRDADWRRFEGPEGHEGAFDSVVSLDLSRVRPERPEGTRVRIGPFAEDDDVHALARALAHSPRRPEVAFEVVVPGRMALDAWTAAGTLDVLRAAGAEIMDRADPIAATLPAGTLLLGGDPLSESMHERGVWTCAARLTLHSPAEAMVSAGAATHAAPPAWDDVIEPAGGAIERGSHHKPGALPPAHVSAFRAVALIEAGDDATAARMLPWGPRAWAARADADDLAAALFRPLDPEAPARARAHGTCVVVAGERFGGGAHAEAVARASAALGLRAVIATSYAEGSERLLALHGVLPLRWLEPGDRREVRVGDELEVPPPTGPAPGGRVALRHLTRGFTFDVRCDLELPLRELARAGGLLRAMRDALAEDAR